MMGESPKARGQRAGIRGGTPPSATDHRGMHLDGASTMKPRFNPIEWTIWFRAMRALKRFSR
jgi:hypothetical protein